MATKKLSSILFSLIFMNFILLGCATEKSELVKVKGTDLTYSEYFKAYDGLDERDNVTFYKPFLINEVEPFLPDQVKNTMNTINTDKLPFKVDEEKAYLVTSKDKNGAIKNQVQLSYLGKDEYKQTDDFLIISVTEADKNPLETYDITNDFDSVGNKLIKKQLTENLPIYQQVLTTDSALLYTYYEENEKGIITIGTAANEFYAYYNGHIYHIGYSLDREKNDVEMQKKMLQLVREFILASKLPQ
ncbi:hypothetical protein [Sporosarcina sp. D27]|uniref:hypothetical protein n=1 Tax=Sporosarcina sp. D27 TaxID=1382305 RepID=UPI000472FC1C|nr:hypothetical protein [Sporosarcina sp. D27]